MKSIIQMFAVALLFTSLMFIYLLDKSLYCMIVLFAAPFLLGKVLSIVYKRELLLCKDFIKSIVKESMKTIIVKVKELPAVFGTPIKAWDTCCINNLLHWTIIISILGYSTGKISQPMYLWPIDPTKRLTVLTIPYSHCGEKMLMNVLSQKGGWWQDKR